MILFVRSLRNWMGWPMRTIIYSSAALATVEAIVVAIPFFGAHKLAFIVLSLVGVTELVFLGPLVLAWYPYMTVVKMKNHSRILQKPWLFYWSWVGSIVLLPHVWYGLLYLLSR